MSVACTGRQDSGQLLIFKSFALPQADADPLKLLAVNS